MQFNQRKNITFRKIVYVALTHEGKLLIEIVKWKHKREDKTTKSIKYLFVYFTPF